MGQFKKVTVAENNGYKDIEQKEDSSHTLDGTKLDSWRWAGLTSSLLIGLLLATIETSISATALIDISRYFDDFPNSSWVILSYLLGYLGFAIVFPRLSDIIGCRATFLTALLIFATFSLGSGFSQTLTQLIICRAFQGIGGTGLFAMTMVVGPRISPLRLWPLFSSLIAIVLGTAYVCGPILGGVITQNSTWRWIYLFNAPFSLAIAVPALILWPKETHEIRQRWQNVDVMGSLLLIAASCLLIFALNQAGAEFYAWNSILIIATLTISSLCWCLFVVWTFFLSYRANWSIDPIFPGKIAVTRPSGPAFLVSFLSGFPLFLTLITLAERLQIVNSQSPIQTGVRLMPLLAFVAVGSATSGALSAKKNRTPETLVTGSALILLGSGLMSTLSATVEVEAEQYGFQILLGTGIGLNLSAMTIMVTVENEQNDHAAVQGALNQARVLGGSMALAISTIVLNQKLKYMLNGLVSSEQLLRIQQSLARIQSLTADQKEMVRKAFVDAFNKNMRISCYISAVAVVASIATWKHKRAPMPTAK